MRAIAPRRAPSSLLWLALLTLLPGAAHAAGTELFAERLTADNIERLRVGGPDAIAGIGDWAIGNGVICAAVSSPDHESVLSDGGGVLVDLGHCGRDDDQWGVLQPMVNLSRDNVMPVREVGAEVAAGQARIVTAGQISGLRVHTVYSVDHHQPTRLRIVSRIEREADGDAVFLFADVALHGHRQLTAFTMASTRPSLSVGFTHPAVDVGSNLAMVNALQRADTQVLVGGSELQPGIAYGWRLVGAWVQRRDGSADPLAHIALNGEHFSIIGAYADTLWLGGGGRPGLLELAQTLLMDLEPGERIVYEREIILGDRADVASVTDQLWPDGPEIVASVGQANTAVHVVRHDDAPITFVRSDAKGRVRFRLPPGEDVRYKLLIAGPGDQFETHPLRVNGPRVDLGALATPEAATLMLPQGEPLRLVFLGVAPTPDPLIGGDGIRFWVGQERIAAATESNHVSLAGAAGDPDHVRLAPGHYRVLATRGPEWSVSSAEIELVAGQRARLYIQPPIRVLDTPGWLSADLHVHAAPSDDSALPLRRRIAAFAAQGADVIVSTEHDNVFDYGPLIRQLGLDDRIASLVGVEITSTSKGPNAPSTSGHANAFPLRRDPLAYRGGAPRGENVRLRTLLADLHARPLAPILQLNHPREAGFDADYGSYFSHLAVGRGAYDPIRPLDHAQNRALIERDRRSGLRDLDFDAVELLNGPSMTRYRLTRGDWLSLIRQGEVRVGTANSDSHSTRHLVALPRNYVAFDGPGGRDLDTEAFMRAVRGGRLYGSTGPILEVTLDGRGPGERFRGAAGELHIVVRAAEWVPVHEVRVFVNGALRQRVDLAESRDLVLPMRFSADAFVTVEVEGEAGPIYAAIAPGFTPFAFSNPIFVDADGDGRWLPIGLQGRLPTTITAPLKSP
ncbi:MAG: PHP domain-containing protein [Deltaproteobacteria bacterium]|nr:PHP domain-containing protein [Deltaproteobacteria bacterium]